MSSGLAAKMKTGNLVVKPKRPVLPLPLFPPEVLDFISSNLDQPSATQFALTCRAFVLHAERPIWRTISTGLNPYYGLSPKIDNPRSLGSNLPSPWTQQEHKAARRECKEGACARLSTVLNLSNKSRIEMVERLVIQSRLETSAAMIGLLGQCYDSQPLTLERYIFSLGLTFPSLTHMRIVHEAVLLSENVPFLTNSAPNLISLDIELTTSFQSRSNSSLNMSTASFDTLRKLRYLRFTSSTENQHIARSIVRIISSSPDLRQAAIRSPGGASSTNNVACWLALSRQPELRDLQFEMDCDDFMECHEATGRPHGFPRLKRLVLSSTDTKDTGFVHLYKHCPSLPALECLYINHSTKPKRQIPLVNLPEPFRSHHRMKPNFAASLRLNQHLHTIHLTGDYNIFGSSEEFPSQGSNEVGDPSGSIRSFKYKSDKEGGELLHARIFTRYLEVGDTARSLISFEPSNTIRKVLYSDERGKPRETIYREHSRDTYQNQTDYKGLEVPLYVIRQMEEAEGYSYRERQGRGIRLGDKGWQVLEDWYSKRRDEIAMNRQKGMSARMAEWGYEGYSITGS